MSQAARVKRLEAARYTSLRRLITWDVNQGTWYEDGQRHDGDPPVDLAPDDLLVRFYHNINMEAL